MTKRTITNAARRKEAILTVLTRLDYDRLHRLERLSTHVLIDGQRAASLEPGGGSSDSTRVESAALQGLPGVAAAGAEARSDDWSRHVERDPIGSAARDVFELLRQIGQLANRIRDCLDYVDAPKSERGRQSSLSECLRCDRSVTGVGNDRLRSGWCNACRMAWARAGRPDRHLFVLRYAVDPTADEDDPETTDAEQAG